MLWALVGLPLVSFLLVSVGIAIYIYLPISYERLAAIELKPDSQHLTLAVHGLGDSPQSWANPLLARINAKTAKAFSQQLAIDWNPYSQRSFRCSVDGKRIGRQLGRQIAAANQLESLHMIAHSCGSFVILGACEAIKASGANIHIKTSYLDPVSIYGGFFWRYGLEKFGSCADSSESYFDRGDSVPGSNQPLKHGQSHDVTEARLQANYQGSAHVWPTLYYQQLWASKKRP